MHKATPEDLELGNLMFGNSRGLYSVEPRSVYQNMFVDFLIRNGFDGYGYHDPYDDPAYENDTFVLRPYYWGEDEEVAELPNFIYKPIGLFISWYKYPMRDAYSNMDVSPEAFRQILKECERSMRRKRDE